MWKLEQERAVISQIGSFYLRGKRWLDMPSRTQGNEQSHTNKIKRRLSAAMPRERSIQLGNVHPQKEMQSRN